MEILTKLNQSLRVKRYSKTPLKTSLIEILRLMERGDTKSPYNSLGKIQVKGGPI